LLAPEAGVSSGLPLFVFSHMKNIEFDLGRLKAVPAAVELLMESSADLGVPVSITLRLRNDGTGPIDLELPGRPVAFDITIFRPDGTQVWRRLARGVVGSALMLVRLAPGEIRDFTVGWDQVDNAGRPVGPGRYTVRGVLPTDKGVLSTPLRDLLIKGNR
jgi:Intracellular proteinase inhibitor